MTEQSTSWFGFDDLFWLTLLVLFLSALIGAVIRRFRLNGCLKLFDDQHVTYINAEGRPLWGDLLVSSQGVELIYDSPYTTARGLIKSSHLVSGTEIGQCLALCRTVHALTDEERRVRIRQIEATFSPGILRHTVRRLRNGADMMRDAIANSLSLFVGAMSGRLGAALGSRKGEVNELGKTLAGTVAYAYEPLLERHIGKPVVLECRVAPGAATPTAEFTGYLVEYTEQYLAIFNIDQAPVEDLELTVTEPVRHPSFGIDFENDRLVFTCTGPDALIVKSVSSAGASIDLDVTLLPGCKLGVRVGTERPVTARVERTHQLDLVCPRSNAQVRFGSQLATDDARTDDPDWRGVAPEEETVPGETA